MSRATARSWQAAQGSCDVPPRTLDRSLYPRQFPGPGWPKLSRQQSLGRSEFHLGSLRTMGVGDKRLTRSAAGALRHLTGSRAEGLDRPQTGAAAHLRNQLGPGETLAGTARPLAGQEVSDLGKGVQLVLVHSL